MDNHAVDPGWSGHAMGTKFWTSNCHAWPALHQTAPEGLEDHGSRCSWLCQSTPKGGLLCHENYENIEKYRKSPHESVNDPPVIRWQLGLPKLPHESLRIHYPQHLHNVLRVLLDRSSRSWGAVAEFSPSDIKSDQNRNIKKQFWMILDAKMQRVVASSVVFPKRMTRLPGSLRK